jgi:hypothetical protein
MIFKENSLLHGRKIEGIILSEETLLTSLYSLMDMD